MVVKTVAPKLAAAAPAKSAAANPSAKPTPQPTPKPTAKPAVSAQPAKPVKSAAVTKPAAAVPVAKAAKAAVPPAPKAAPKPAPAKKVSVQAPVTLAVGNVVLQAVTPTKRGRRAAVAPQPTPQPTPSHSPDAAKATFSNSPERVMNFPVHSPARKDPKLANNWKNKPADQLTDDEVLSMSDDDYMNDAQLAFFRHKLVRLKTDILTSAVETTEHLREDTVVVPDPADRATIEEEHALELRTRDRERKLLKKIQQSIARIDGNDYGYCDETGEPIGVGRLIARPTASLSLEAQQRRELKQKMFGD